MSTKAEDTQKNILNTARKHFLKDGLTGASLRNIVKDAGLTTGAFYKYYPTKEALFEDRKSTRLNSSHRSQSRMPSSA